VRNRTERGHRIDRWGVVELYVAALKKAAWIEAVSLGYAAGKQLRFLVKSKSSFLGTWHPVQCQASTACRHPRPPSTDKVRHTTITHRAFVKTNFSRKVELLYGGKKQIMQENRAKKFRG
jgi:hypothetical protein